MENFTESFKKLDITKEEVEKIGEALKNKEFRKMLIDYVEEIQNPENQKIYEQEITELERQRGVDVTFVKPCAGYVIKTSADGEKKVFVNICSNDIIQQYSSEPSNEGNTRGQQWQVPHSLTPPRDDVDKKGNLCKVFDFVCHSSTLKLAKNNGKFKEMLNNMACEAIEKNFNVQLDKKNVKFPKMEYKGKSYSAVIRKPSKSTEIDEENREFMDTLFSKSGCPYSVPSSDKQPQMINVPKKSDNESKYTTPKYNIKHRSHVELEQFIEHKTAKLNSAIPKELVVEVILPLIKSAADVTLDVNEKSLQLTSEKPAKYKLNLNLPYEVDESLGNAKFEKDKKKLVITLPVKRNESLTLSELNREDSGIDSDHCSLFSSSPIEENESSDKLVIEISKSDEVNNKQSVLSEFLDPNVSYVLPDFNSHIFEKTFIFTLNVKNVAEESLHKTFYDHLKAVHLKFMSVSSGYFPIYYAFCFKSSNANIDYDNVITEVWDNNVEVQIPVVNNSSKEIESYFVGINENNFCEYNLKTVRTNFSDNNKRNDEETELTGTTQNIPNVAQKPVMMSTDQSEDENSIEKTKKEKKKNKSKSKQSTKRSNSPRFSSEERENSNSQKYSSRAIDIGGICESSGDELSYSYSPGNKGILKNLSLARRSVSRSMSESSIDDSVFMSFEHCHSIDSVIPEEQQVSTSLKKTVRFNDVVSKQVFRSNSSILGQRRKNQRKAKAKKRAHDRKHSESELSENEEKKEISTINGDENSSETGELSGNENKTIDNSDRKVHQEGDFTNIFLMDFDF